MRTSITIQMLKLSWENLYRYLCSLHRNLDRNIFKNLSKILINAWHVNFSVIPANHQDEEK